MSLPERLAPGSVLLHVGPYKTGTTSLQKALFSRQAELPALGVAYPGKAHRAERPGWGALGWSRLGRQPVARKEWTDFAEEVRAHGDLRVCVSTEDFGSLGRVELARQIVDDLGGDNVHVIATCRALHRLLPSHWQERVKSSLDHRTYVEWLRSVLLPEEREQAGVAFWRSHDLERTAGTWIKAIGAERFTLVVTDDSDRQLLPATFEAMLGLPRGLLSEPVPGAESPAASGATSNASLSMNSVELIRRLNVEARERGWEASVYSPMLRRGIFPAVLGRSVPGIDQAIPDLPPWSLEPIAEIGRQRLATIQRLGIRTVGDPQCLLLPPDLTPTDTPPPPDVVPISTATDTLAGVLERDFTASSAAALEAGRRQGTPS